MKVQYRISNRNGEYYPQVRTKKFLFWSSWKRIAKHLTGYGMYELPNRDYPKTKTECEEIIKDFDRWLKEENTVKESYSNFNVNDKKMKKLLFTIVLPLTMVCCQSENNDLRETDTRPHKCWYANISGGNFYGVGRSHTDNHQEYEGKVIYLNESTTFNYHCFRSDLYTEEQMKYKVQDIYR